MIRDQGYLNHRKAMRRRIALLKHFVRNSSRVFELFRESFWSAHASSRRYRMLSVRWSKPYTLPCHAD